MAYKHIDNLYKNKDILFFRECFATEKVHGTSAHISYNEGTLSFFAGGTGHEGFVAIFDQEDLLQRFRNIDVLSATVYGEAYGGKIMKMSDTYGKEIQFIAFEVKIGDVWLNVPDACAFVESLGLEFVPFIRVPTNIDTLNSIRDLPSEVAFRRGCGADKLREGIVLRPLIELRKNNGKRIVAKYKSDAFAERHHQPKVKKEQNEVMIEAREIAEEWVTHMRLTHVMDKIRAVHGGQFDFSIEDTGDVIKAMIEDVTREAKGEILENKSVNREIGRKTALMFKEWVKSRAFSGVEL